MIFTDINGDGWSDLIFAASADNHLTILTNSWASFAILAFTQPHFSPQSGFHFNLNGPTGKTYIVQGSIDLTNWVSIQTNTNSMPIWSTLDPATNFDHRFYRAIVK